MKQKIYTSLYLPEYLRLKLAMCVEKLGVDKSLLLSALCCKAGAYVCTKVQWFKAVEYQERGGDYEITPVCFFAADHEYMHAQRLACKVSVSKLLACAMELFLDEIMEKGINEAEIAQLGRIQNSYNYKNFFFRNCIVNTAKNDRFEEYIMKIKIKKKNT